jgi:hypothetical protein
VAAARNEHKCEVVMVVMVVMKREDNGWTMVEVA